MKIIGIAGLPRSGKDTLAEQFIQAGYFGFSFGDFTRKTALERHKDKPDPISVENMTETSNWLREQHGADVILQKALKEFNQAKTKNGNYKGLVLYSVRAPVEVDWILTHDGELIWVEANDEIRYQRGLENLRPGESRISFEEFLRHEALQWKPQPGAPKEVQMDISYVKSHATKIIENNGTKDQLINKIKQVLNNR